MSVSHFTKEKLQTLKAVALDVDGVLTDGGVWWGTNGEELKHFCFADVMGLSLARRAGLQIALISGESSPIVDRYAKKLAIRHVVTGCRDKASALQNFAVATRIDISKICFMGDDINDLAAMQIAGLSCSPADAATEVLSQAQFVASKAGGAGAVRELINAILLAQGASLQEILTRKEPDVEHTSNPIHATASVESIL